jgi:predicted nucleic acid-binding protein
VVLSRYVVDTNIAVKWHVPEQFSDIADRLLRTERDFIAPDNFVSEVSQTLVSKVRSGELTLTGAVERFGQIMADFRLVESETLVERAMRIALAYQRSVYDSLYLVLAIEEGCQFVTADGKAYSALKDDFATHLLWVEDIPDPV